jgi:nucleoside permease NupC
MDDKEREHYKQMIQFYKAQMFNTALIAFGVATVLVGFVAYVVGYDAGCR